MSRENIIFEIRETDRKLRCLDACFIAISRPEMLDAVNLQILALKARRAALFSELRTLGSQQVCRENKQYFDL